MIRRLSSLSSFAVGFSLIALAPARINATPCISSDLLGLASGTASVSTSQEGYIWPLKGRYTLTSTFAEYRRGHFHAGLDISTGGRTGMPVRAIAAGHIVRVKVSPFGYGKAVYIKQHDGRYAVYAHLKQFTAEINALVKKKQLATGQYEVEIYPPAEKYPINQGESIGVSGKSGCAAPHLHFELRDESNRPINPLTHGLSISDHVAPRFMSLCGYPIGPETSVNGEQRPCIVNLKPAAKQNTYRARKKVRVHGKFALSAYIRDEQERNTYPLGPYRLETFLDGELVFATNMERFSYQRTHDVDIAFDYRLVTLNAGKFLRQFAFADNKSEVYADRGRDAGIIDTSPWNRYSGNAAHAVRLVATDACENRSEAVLEVFRDDEPVVRVVAASMQADALHLEAAADDPDGTVARVHFRIWKEGGGVIAKASCPAAETGKFLASIQIPRSVASSDLVIEAVAEDDLGVRSKPMFTPVNVSAENCVEPVRLNLHGEWYENSVFLTVKLNRFLRSPPLITVVRNNSPPTQIETTMETPYAASCLYRPELRKSGPLTVSATAYDLQGKATDATWSTRVYTVWRRTGGAADYAERLHVSFPPNGVYRPILVRIEPTDHEVRAKIPAITEAYRIEPADEPLDGKAALTFAFEEGDPLRGAGIYVQNAKGEWDYVSTRAQEAEKRLTASINRLGTYAVLRDTSAPQIYAIRPRPGSTVTTGTPTMSAHIEDTGSGIDYKTIQVHLDGKLIICEYDPYQNTISHQLGSPLGKGEHMLSISLSDYAGNTSHATSSFIEH